MSKDANTSPDLIAEYLANGGKVHRGKLQKIQKNILLNVSNARDTLTIQTEPMSMTWARVSRPNH